MRHENVMGHANWSSYRFLQSEESRRGHDGPGTGNEQQQPLHEACPLHHRLGQDVREEQQQQREDEQQQDEAAAERVPPIPVPGAVPAQGQSDQPEHDGQRAERDEEPKRMQGVELGEQAGVHDARSGEYQERGTGQQPLPADPWPQRLGEADGEEHGQQTRDHQVRVEDRGMRTHAQIANHLRDGRVAWTQQTINGDHQHSDGSIEDSAPHEESYQASLNRSRNFGMSSHLCKQFRNLSKLFGDGWREKNGTGSGKKSFVSLTCFLSREGEKLFTPSLQAHLDGPPTDGQPLPDLQTRKALVLVEPQASPVVGRQALEYSLDDLMIIHHTLQEEYEEEATRKR